MAYGMNDGSQILNAVNQYYQYSEGRRQYNLNRADRLAKEEKARADRLAQAAREQSRWERTFNQAEEQFQMNRADDLAAEMRDQQQWEIQNRRDQEAHDLEVAEEARRVRGMEATVDLQGQRINEMERQEIERLRNGEPEPGTRSSATTQVTREGRTTTQTRDPRAETSRNVGRGASGRGKSDTQIRSNGDGTSTPVIVTDEGEMPLTANPNDNNSSPLRIPDEEVDSVSENAINTHEVFTQNGFNYDEAMAATRASLHTDPKTGETRQATPEQFVANLREQGLWKTVKEQGLGNIVQMGVDEAAGAMKQNAENIGNYFEPGGGGAVALAKEGLTHAPKMTGGALKKSAEFSVAAADKVAEFLFGKDAPASVKEVVKKDKDGAATIKPSVTNSPEKVTKAKEEIESQNVEPPKTKFVRETEALSVEEKIDAVRNKFSSLRKQNQLAGEMYLGGSITRAEYDNYAETGDFRYSQHDLDVNRMELSKMQSARVKNLQSAKLYAAKARKAVSTDKDGKGEDYDKKFRESTERVAEDAVNMAVDGRVKNRGAIVNNVQSQVQQALRATVIGSGLAIDQFDTVRGEWAITEAAAQYAGALQKGDPNATLNKYLVSTMNRFTPEQEAEYSENFNRIVANTGWDEDSLGQLTTTMTMAGLKGDEFNDNLQRVINSGLPPQEALQVVEADLRDHAGQ